MKKILFYYYFSYFDSYFDRYVFNKDSNQKPAIKIKDNEIITSVPNCSEPTIKIDKIRNIKLLDNVEIGNKQVGYKEDKCYAGYFDTQFGTCFIYINPNIHSYIYFETKDNKCLINYESEEKQKSCMKL